MEQLALSVRIRKFLEWPFWLSPLWVVLGVLLYFFFGIGAAVLCGIGFAVYLCAAFFLYRAQRQRIAGQLFAFATGYGQVQNRVLREFVLPYALLDLSGNVLWMNDEFLSISGKDRSYHRSVTAIFPEITKDELPGRDMQTECPVRWKDRYYQAAMQKLVMEELVTEGASAEDCSVIALYLFDETELTRLGAEAEANRLVFGLLTLDNYDEVIEKGDDLQKSLLLALIERKINRYFSDVDGFVRKTDNYNYFFLVRKKSFDELEKNRFRILEDVKAVNVGNDSPMTISVGIGFGSESFLENAEGAHRAIELALGRGGDQVVIREGYNTRYFGGKTETMEKYTRVKARVKALALKEILSGKDAVLIMGHKIPDADVLGAAVGIYRCAKSIEKPAHIVMDSPPEAIRLMVESFTKNPEYGDDMFITGRAAREMVGDGVAVVVVDTNKPGYTECEDLLRRTNAVVVLDHHRQGRDIIENAVLSYIEPYASSASEMVAEVVQYFDDKLRLRPREADALYGGIMVDTSNFLTRSGVRTFEAAAYLRRSGADVTRIRKMFRDSMEDVRAKSAGIASAEIFDDSFAISVCESAGLKSPTVVAAQTANELLSVVGVKASFVLTDYNHMIYISARAIDEVNVQLIMERLGGGGHLNIAGAQLQDATVEEAKRLLKDTIKIMKEEGDI